MANNKDLILKQYGDGIKEENRHKRSRASSLEFYYTKKHLEPYITKETKILEIGCGTGYYGLKVHEAALKRGVKITGATVHYVDEGTDTGPIIMQKAVEVKEGDTPEILQRRVMEEAEWVILPKSIGMIAKEKK